MTDNIFDTDLIRSNMSLSDQLHKLTKINKGIEKLTERMMEYDEDGKALKTLKQSRKVLLKEMQGEMQEKSIIHVPVSATEIMRIETKKQKRVIHSVPKAMKEKVFGRWVEEKRPSNGAKQAVHDFFSFCSEKEEKECTLLCKRSMSRKVKEELGLSVSKKRRKTEPGQAVDEDEDELESDMDTEDERDEEDVPQRSIGETIA